MDTKKRIIISVLILILVSSSVDSTINSENWGITEFEGLKLKYTWMINNFELAHLQRVKRIDSPDFWPSGNETFKWNIQLGVPFTDSENYTIILYHNYNDTVYVNLTLSLGSLKFSTKEIFNGEVGYGNRYIQRHQILEGCSPNGTLIIDCEIIALYKVFEASGTNRDKCNYMKDKLPQTTLSDNLHSLLRDEKYSDLIIMVGNNRIRAHKAILAVRSAVFASLLTRTYNNYLEIKDVQPELFKQLLYYIYTDKMDNINESLAKDLLTVAIKYDLKKLKAKCEEVLCNSIKDNNVFEIFELADQNQIPELKSQAINFVADHPVAVINTSKFKNMERIKPHPLYDIFRSLIYKLNSSITSE